MMTNIPDYIETLEDAYYDIMDRLGAEVWSDFARFVLQLSLDDIEKTASFQPRKRKISMFKLWEKTLNDSSIQQIYDLHEKYKFHLQGDECNLETSPPLGDIPKQLSVDEESHPPEPAEGTSKKIIETHIDSDHSFLKKLKSKFQQKTEDVYPIRKKGKKGMALILTNEFKGQGYRERHGASNDDKNMTKLWTEMGCDISKSYESSADKMLTLIKSISCLNKEDYDFIVIVISSHGGLEPNTQTHETEEVFHGVDSKPVKVNQILEMFSNANAQQLAGIPKLFIFQFCRGMRPDKGVVSDALGIPGDASKVDAEGKSISRLPEISDIVVAYPTHRSYLSWRNECDGSWFITLIWKIFSENWKKEHVVDMLTIVNAKMKVKTAFYDDDGSDNFEESTYPVKAMSKFESSLTKKFYLFPQ